MKTPKLRDEVKNFLKKLGIGKSKYEEMADAVDDEEWMVLGTDASNEDFKADCSKHEDLMSKYEGVFSHHNEIRKNFMKKAVGKKGLTRSRLRAMAYKHRLKAKKASKKFFAELKKFERKQEILAAAEVRRINADEGMNVKEDDIVEDVRDELMNNEEGQRTAVHEEAEMAVRQELESEEFGPGYQEEEELIKKHEEGEIDDDDLDLDTPEAEMDDVLMDEMGEELDDIEDENMEDMPEW